MRLAIGLVLVLLGVSAGCQHIELRNHTVRQATTLTDLQYRQVLSNLAMFSKNPDALPFYSVTGTGVTSITDTLTDAGGFNWDKATAAAPFLFDKASNTLTGTNTALEQWTTGSIVNPDELLLMRCVYQKTVGAGTCACDCEKMISDYFKSRQCYLESMQPGWFCVGHLRDVPKHAAYVGRHGSLFAWVMPENVDKLTKLTLAIMDIATAVKAGEVGRIDLLASAVKQTTDRAKDLADLVSKYPKPAPGTTDPNFDRLKAELDKTLLVLESLYKGHTPAEVLVGERVTRVTTKGPNNTFQQVDRVVPVLQLDGFPKDQQQSIREEVANRLQQLLTAPMADVPATFGRERKNFYNPLQPAAIPVIP